jgi:hypothetical protein
MPSWFAFLIQTLRSHWSCSLALTRLRNCDLEEANDANIHRCQHQVVGKGFDKSDFNLYSILYQFVLLYRLYNIIIYYIYIYCYLILIWLSSSDVNWPHSNAATAQAQWCHHWRSWRRNHPERHTPLWIKGAAGCRWWNRLVHFTHVHITQITHIISYFQTWQCHPHHHHAGITPKAPFGLCMIAFDRRSL